MAPRGRSRKFKGERMEEVLRHFRIENLGFDEEIVKKVAKQVLAEYDAGEDAWCLIALNNYQLLIEQILEYQEINQPEGSSGAGNEDDFFEDEPANRQALTVSGEPSTAITAVNASQETPDLLLTNEAAEETESAKSPVARRHLPCYGWIDENEEGDKPAEILYLTPAGEIAQVGPIASEKNLRKRGSKWDMKPEDP